MKVWILLNWPPPRLWRSNYVDGCLQYSSASLCAWFILSHGTNAENQPNCHKLTERRHRNVQTAICCNGFLPFCQISPLNQFHFRHRNVFDFRTIRCSNRPFHQTHYILVSFSFAGQVSQPVYGRSNASPAEARLLMLIQFINRFATLKWADERYWMSSFDKNNDTVMMIMMVSRAFQCSVIMHRWWRLDRVRLQLCRRWIASTLHINWIIV